MQIAEFAADGAVAVRDLELCRCDDLEADAPTVTTAGMRRHVRGG
jgi:hypothetical protein